jgi:hypothetical protein
MIFIVRAAAGDPPPPFPVKMTRRTPAIVPDSAGKTDFFCLGDPEAAVGLPEEGAVVRVHDGWYADDTGGGMAIWGQGMFWEVRPTPLTVAEAAGPEAWPTPGNASPDAEVNVRNAIFRGS